MRTVNIAELKNRLSMYITYAKDGEEIIVRDRNRPVAKLIPFSSEDATEEELSLVADGIMRLPKGSGDIEDVFKLPIAQVKGRRATQALLEERNAR